MRPKRAGRITSLSMTKPPKRPTSDRDSVLLPVPGRPTIRISMEESNGGSGQTPRRLPNLKPFPSGVLKTQNPSVELPLSEIFS